MSGKANGGDTAQEDILSKLEDTAAQRQIDIGGGVMVNMGQEDYGMNAPIKRNLLLDHLLIETQYWVVSLRIVKVHVIILIAEILKGWNGTFRGHFVN